MDVDTYGNNVLELERLLKCPRRPHLCLCERIGYALYYDTGHITLSFDCWYQIFVCLALYA